MPAIAGFDDLHAWLIRGFVEAGVPDVTGSSSFLPDGGLDLDSLYTDQGASGLLLTFLGQAQDAPVPDDEYTYTVCVVRDATGERVVVRCAETLYHHTFAGVPAPQLGVQILTHVRAHNEAFTAWRAKGGAISYAERLSIPEVRGVACDRGLVALLADLRRKGVPLSAGPASAWWGVSRQAMGAAIKAGKGQDPTYRLGKGPTEAEQAVAENQEYADRVRKVGGWLLGVGGASLFWLFAGTGVAWYKYGSSYAAGVAVGAFVFAFAFAFAGWQMRSLRMLTPVRIALVVAMLPCVGPCCVAGAPLGAWGLWVLKDPRARRVFQ